MTVETSPEAPVDHSATGLVPSDCHRVEAVVDQVATCNLVALAAVLRHTAAVHTGPREGSFRSVADLHHPFVASTLGLTL